MRAWSTDVRHLPPTTTTGLPAAAQRRAEFTRELVEAATSRRAGRAWPSAVHCIARAGRKPCGGWIEVGRLKPDTIEWSCKTCGEHGAITGFEHSEHDFSAYISTKKCRLWGVDQESRDVLYAATAVLPELRAIIARATPVAEVPGFLRIDASVEELDELYTLVEQLTDMTRSRRRIELLDDLRGGLCTAIDGF
jgi:hypothetical protein